MMLKGEIGITFGAFDLFHAGHIAMLREAKSVCSHLIVCIQTDPSLDRDSKNSPVQSIVERQIQVSSCKYVDETFCYSTEDELLEILHTMDWDVRIIGEEYRGKDFTGRDFTYPRCHFNKRPHKFSTSELRDRVAKKSQIKKPPRMF